MGGMETNGIPLDDFPKFFMRKPMVFEPEMQKFKVYVLLRRGKNLNFKLCHFALKSVEKPIEF